MRSNLDSSKHATVFAATSCLFKAVALVRHLASRPQVVELNVMFRQLSTGPTRNPVTGPRGGAHEFGHRLGLPERPYREGHQGNC